MRLANLFTDHAVLQRHTPVPVWGWTTPKQRVQVTLGPYTAMTRAGEDGKFLARLPPMPAGGPHELQATTPEGERASIKDVMVGEVWICSGQSNMEWTVKDVPFDPATLTEADTLVRSLKVPQRTLLGRATDVDACWQAADPSTVRDFTAVGFFFARRLSRELGVAVGLLNASWGGTRIEAWISREELMRHEWTRGEVKRYEATVSSTNYWTRFDDLDPDDPAWIEKIRQMSYPRDPDNIGFRNGWADTECADAAWKPVALPGAWVRFGHDTNGVFWFRRTIMIPPEWAGKELRLGIGAVDKQDTTYFDGVNVGATGKDLEEQHWCVPRVYTVPGRLVKHGRATIAVRAYSFLYEGGMIGPREQMFIQPADGSGQPIRLDGEWRMKIEHDFGKVSAVGSQSYGPGNPQTPSILNDNMIQPLVPYAIRGATWYQGESNEGIAAEYGWMLRAMISDWRRAWGEGDFPFLTVQLANFRVPAPFNAASTWAVVREEQLRSLQLPDTGVAVAVDIGDETDIHPRNKQDVGWRLAQWALARTYGKHIVPSGPLYRDYVIEGDAIRLRFDHVGGGLVSKDGDLRTFVIAGGSKVFKPAEARIEDDTLVVRSKDVPEPVAVRYAWADNPAGCNLCNRDGFPASPFRTDAW